MGQHRSASASRLLGLDGLEVVSAGGGGWRVAAGGPDDGGDGRLCGLRGASYPVPPRAALTERARAEACRRVGRDAQAVAAVARDLGVGWAIIMRAVGEHGTPLGEDPGRLEGVAALGLDETSFLRATRTAPTRWVPSWSTWSAAGCWTWWPTAPGERWTVGLVPGLLPGWPRSARWRWILGAVTPARWSPRWSCDRGGGSLPCHPPGQHGGRPGPPSRAGEVVAAWQELLRAIYAAVGMSAARAAHERFYRWADGVGVAELLRLARTVRAWELDIDRRRLLLHGGVTWQIPQTASLRGRSPRRVA